MLETEIVANVRAAAMTPAQVGREFHKLLDAGVSLRPAGTAQRDPLRLPALGYTPKHKISLFDVTYYLTNQRQDHDLGFFVAYVRLGEGDLFPRIFYKDLSLVWRSATHVIRSDSENWIGKGELKPTLEEDGHELLHSAEETTDLPLEIQAALDIAARAGGRVRWDHRAVGLILRNAPDHRFDPYEDFIGPRRRARSDRRNLINRGKKVAWFERSQDPTSLRFAPGFEPDFRSGVLEVSHSKSRLYGGALGKYRILSRNRTIQYQFIAAPRQVWIIPPQALTREIMSYGVRTIDIEADDDLFVPGYEYHFIDDDQSPPRLHSQIPEGYAGEASAIDPFRADASPWLEKLPVIREFRRKVLGGRRERSARR